MKYMCIAVMKEYETKEADSINGFDRFQTIISPLLNKEPMYYRGKDESSFYGNMESILKYADINIDEAALFPTVLHGDIYGNVFGFPVDRALILSGNYYKMYIHERYPFLPVFTVGPYIHYAASCYDRKKQREIKEQYGKILTIFLPHSIENIGLDYDVKLFIDKVLYSYRTKFDSIWGCVYWTDINSPMCSYLKQQGIHLVTAGCRFDKEFDNRLKTILQLSDATVCGVIGTNIQYALYLDKPTAYIKCELSFDVPNREKPPTYCYSATYEEELRKFEQLFNEKLEITPEQKEFMNEVAGYDCVRNKEYIQNILKISKDILRYSDYDVSKCPIGVYTAYNEYLAKNDFTKAQMLRSAVGKSFIYIFIRPRSLERDGKADKKRARPF